MDDVTRCIRALPLAGFELAMRELIARGPVVIEPILQATELRRVGMGRAAAVLRVFGRAAVDALVDDLAHRESARRVRAAELLGTMGSAFTVERLAAAAASADPAPRHRALADLGVIRDPESLAVMLDTAAAAGEAVRLCAVLPLIEALAAPDPELQFAAVGALSVIRDPRAVMPLVGLVESADPNVQRAAIYAFDAAPDERAASALMRVATDPAQPGRALAVSALGRCPGAGVFERLLALAADPDREIGCSALLALGRARDPRAYGVLTAELAAKDWYRRARSALGLAELGDARALDALERHLTDASRRVRKSIKLAIMLLVSRTR